MDAWLSVFAGVGLAAACGFRVFVPMLVAAVAARADYLPLSDGFGWLDSGPAIICLGIAAALEAGGYLIPWIDHLLDTIASPAAAIAGAVLAGSVIVDVEPWLQWTLAIVAGGGAAGVIQTGTVATRAASTLTTGGLGNPIVSLGELGSSLLVSLLAIIVPIVTLVLVAGLLVWAVSRLMRRPRVQQPPEPLP